MSPLLIALLAGATAAIPVIIALVGLLLPLGRKWVDEHVASKDVEALRAATKGAYLLVSSVSSKTSNTIDDALADILKLVADEFQKARGKDATPAQLEHAARIALSMHTDPSKPSLPVKTAPNDLGAMLRGVTASVASLGNGSHAKK